MKTQNKPILTTADIIDGFCEYGLLAAMAKAKSESEAPFNVVGDGESNVNVKAHTKDSLLTRRRRKKAEEDQEDEVAE